MTAHDPVARRPETTDLYTIVGKAELEGPQFILIGDHSPAVVLSQVDYDRLIARVQTSADRRTGAELIEILQKCPVADFEFSWDREFAEDRTAF